MYQSTSEFGAQGSQLGLNGVHYREVPLYSVLIIVELVTTYLFLSLFDADQSLDELEKLMVLLLGCVVQCDSKGPLIEKMKGMQVGHQHALVSHIQQVTDTTDYVCSYDWTSFEEMSKE